jgi:hypothetical protein
MAERKKNEPLTPTSPDKRPVLSLILAQAHATGKSWLAVMEEELL